MSVAIWALCVVIAFFVNGVDLQTDVTALTWEKTDADAPAAPRVSPEVLVALQAADIDQTLEFARRFVDDLRQDPRVQSASLGPQAPSETFMDWIWDNRFNIVPPAPDAFAAAQMMARLEDGKAVFSSVEGMGLGDRMLLDPTGSFAQVVSKLNQAENTLPVRDGVWVSKTGQAAIIFVTLADQKFDAMAVDALATDMRARAREQGVSALVVGAQVIAAQTTLANTKASALASGVATVLLLGWLMWCLRSCAVITVFIPLVVGVATAIVVVQAVFGSVHVVALGFGGALLGLALDYPVHVMGHPGAARARAYRLITLGAATTSVSFLAMLGSGISALEQIGVFVASGLLVAAGVAIVLPGSGSQKLRIFSLDRFVWRLPYKPLVECSLILGGLAFAVSLNGAASLTLFEPPAQVKQDIQDLGQLIDLPSARYAVIVRGETLDDLLIHEAQLAPVLDQAILEGQLNAYAMLQQMMNPKDAEFPTPVAFRDVAIQALTGAGMNASFAEAQTRAYANGLQARPIQHADLLRFPETRGLAMRVTQTADGWQEKIPLYLPAGVAQPAFRITTQNAELSDLVAPLQRSLSVIQSQMIRWLSIGFGLGAVLLMLGLRSWHAAWPIVRTTSASVAVTASILVAVFGGLSIFHIVALALVAGIGVDYSIFFRERSDGSEDGAAGRSIALCASSTLLTFTVLCFSNVLILQQIGMTVIIGLTLMLTLTLARTEERAEP